MSILLFEIGSPTDSRWIIRFVMVLSVAFHMPFLFSFLSLVLSTHAPSYFATNYLHLHLLLFPLCYSLRPPSWSRRILFRQTITYENFALSCFNSPILFSLSVSVSFSYLSILKKKEQQLRLLFHFIVYSFFYYKLTQQKHGIHVQGNVKWQARMHSPPPSTISNRLFYCLTSMSLPSVLILGYVPDGSDRSATPLTIFLSKGNLLVGRPVDLPFDPQRRSSQSIGMSSKTHNLDAC